MHPLNLSPLELDTYGNIFSYMGLPLSRDLTNPNIDAFIMGIPFDLATTGRSGTRYGPNAVRQASAQLRWEDKRWPWQFTLSDRYKAADYGDLVWELSNGHDMFDVVQKNAEQIIESGKTVLSIGGDHVVALPLLRAHSKKYGKLALIHFDAHTDNEQDDNVLNHGSMFFHAENQGIIDPEHSIQVGIRTEYTRATHNFKVLDADYVNNHGVQNVIEEIKARVGDQPAYLSFDIDCLDPAFAPGTGTPVAGGISTNMALQIIRGLQGINIVGLDLVEVAPSYDHAEVTSLAAATLMLDMLHVLAANKSSVTG